MGHCMARAPSISNCTNSDIGLHVVAYQVNSMRVYSFVTVYCMNLMIFLCVTLKLLVSCPSSRQNPGDATECGLFSFHTRGWTSPALREVGGSWSPGPVSIGVLASLCCCCWWWWWWWGWWSLSELSVKKNSRRWSHMCRWGIVGRVCCLITGLFPLELIRPSVVRPSTISCIQSAYMTSHQKTT